MYIRIRFLSAALGFLALGVAGCGDDGDSDGPVVFDGPVALEDFGSFYVPPDPLPAGDPGDILHVQEVLPLAPASRAWRVLYLSQTADGSPVAVSGLIAAPDGEPPPGGRDVVSWAHGTKGVNDPCAPSRGYLVGHHFVDIAPQIIVEGWVAVGTDYEGLGTPGVHPYLVSVSEARGQLDIVRAAQQLPDVGASHRYAVWGRSQGGHASLAAAEAATSYAPELVLVGAIAAAPAANMPVIFLGSANLGLGFNWLAAVALEAAWGISIDSFYEPEALAEIRRLVDGNQACSGDFQRSIDALGGVGMLPAWQEHLPLLLRSSVGEIPLAISVLISQGDADATVPKLLTDFLVDQMCALGTNVKYLENPGEGHIDSSRLHMAEFRAWTRARFAAEPAPGCQAAS